MLIHQKLPTVISSIKAFDAEIVVENPTKEPVEEVYLSGRWTPSHRLGVTEPPPLRSEGRPTWLLGRLGPGERQHIRIRFEPTPGNEEREFRSDFEVSYRTARSTQLRVPIRQSEVVLSVNIPPVAIVGQPLNLELKLNNRGQHEARGIFLRSTLPESLQHPKGSELEAEIGLLPAGHTEPVGLTLTPTRPGLLRAGLCHARRPDQVAAIRLRIEETTSRQR